MPIDLAAKTKKQFEFWKVVPINYHTIVENKKVKKFYCFNMTGPYMEKTTVVATIQKNLKAGGLTLETGRCATHGYTYFNYNYHAWSKNWDGVDITIWEDAPSNPANKNYY